jgi:hypothetical protein
MGVVIGWGVRKYGLGVLLLAGFAVWAAWLLLERKSLVDYLVIQARAKPMLPLCEWVPLGSENFATMGFSLTESSAWKWTSQKKAILAFRAKTGGPGAAEHVDIGLVSVVGRGVTVSSDGHKLGKIANEDLLHGNTLQLPLSSDAGNDVHLVSFQIARPKPPNGREQRWLGIAISKIRVCSSVQASSG